MILIMALLDEMGNVVEATPDAPLEKLDPAVLRSVNPEATGSRVVSEWTYAVAEAGAKAGKLATELPRSLIVKGRDLHGSSFIAQGTYAVVEAGAEAGAMIMRPEEGFVTTVPNLKGSVFFGTRIQLSDKTNGGEITEIVSARAEGGEIGNPSIHVDEKGRQTIELGTITTHNVDRMNIHIAVRRADGQVSTSTISVKLFDRTE
jgi:hypothetical protein